MSVVSACAATVTAVIAAPPQVTVISSDGSGTLARATGSVKGGTHGNTVAFVYTAAAGGMADGIVTIRVPDGWSTPSIKATDAGFVAASAGNLSVSGNTIMVSNVTLGTGATLTVIYGSRAGGGPGASSPKSVGPRIWNASQQSTPSGTLKPLK
jgi:hypothetical protein